MKLLDFLIEIIFNFNSWNWNMSRTSIFTFLFHNIYERIIWTIINKIDEVSVSISSVIVRDNKHFFIFLILLYNFLFQKKTRIQTFKSIYSLDFLFILSDLYIYFMYNWNSILQHISNSFIFIFLNNLFCCQCPKWFSLNQIGLSY
jgi:hypothetical protein